MRKTLLIWILITILLLPSCGPATPAEPTTTPPPPHSIAEPQAGFTLPYIPPAQSGTRAYNLNIRFEHFTPEDGLSQSVVNAILQDRMGFLWIATDDGLNRYDGYTFEIFKPENNDPTSLSDNWITSLAEDQNGYLWIGTRFGGLNKYDPSTGAFTHYLHKSNNPSTLSSNFVTSIAADKDGLWIGTDSGLDYLIYDSDTIVHYRASIRDPNSLSSNSVSTLYIDPNENLWVGTSDSGLNLYDRSTGAFHVFKHSENIFTSISSNRITSILVDRSGRLWVGTASGLNHSDTMGEYFSHFTHAPNEKDSISSNSIYTIYQDHSNGIWVGTKEGLNRYDEKRENFIRYSSQPFTSNSLSRDEVISIYEDKSGLLWIGTYGGGLNKYNRQQDYFYYYRSELDNPNSLSGNFIMPIVVGDNGTAWIGAFGSGLNRFNFIGNQFKRFEHDPNNPNSLNSNDVTSLELDSKGLLWIGTNRGLDRYDPNTGIFTHFFPNPTDSTSLSGAPVYTIYEDPSGEIWVGTLRGLNQFDPETETFIHFETNEENGNQLIDNQITALLQTTSLGFWIGTFDEGLIEFNPDDGSIKTYKSNPDDPSSLNSNSIFCIYQSRNGDLWVGTSGGGLNRYNPENGTFTSYTQSDGLPNNVVYGILEDERGFLWLSTNFGLSQFDPTTETFRNYTASDGLQSNEFNQNAFARDKNGFMYFGGINGLNVFKPENIEGNPIAPPVVLTSFTSQDGKSLDLSYTPEYTNEITIAWPQDSFEFEFAAFSYGQPLNNEYAYMLEGFDKNWNEIGNKRTGRYTNLPGGTYTLRLRGSNSDGVWNENGQYIRITVIPPFWETWWFRSLMVIAVGLIAAGSIRWRVKNVEKRNRDLERLVQRRTSDLEKRTREMEALYHADEKILRNVTVQQVFQTLVHVSVSMLKADRSVVFAWNEEHTRILPRVSQGFHPDTLFALNFGMGEGLVGRAMKNGETVIVHDLRLENLRSDIQTVIRAEGIQSFAHFPIIVDGKVIAVFNVGYTRPNAINDDTVRLFTALVHRAALSIANMHLFEQTKDLAVMEERNRLARDLHDSAKQKAFAALAQLGTANGMFRTRQDGIQPHLSEAENLVYEVIQELTFLIQEIYPIALQEKGLPTTLREYVYEWENRNDAVANLTIQNERPLPLDTEQAIYRVIQESLANVSRHSKSRQVDISLVYNPDSLQVIVADYGCGFNVDQKAKGMGLRSMRDRITSIRGSLQINSAPGQGTRVFVQVPLKVPAGAEKEKV